MKGQVIPSEFDRGVQVAVGSRKRMMKSSTDSFEGHKGWEVGKSHLIGDATRD